MLTQALKNSLFRSQMIAPMSRFSFATANGDGVSDPKNPKVFFTVAKNGSVLGDIKFEVSYSKFDF